MLQALRAPFSLAGQTVHVGASIGVVTSCGAPAQAEELLRDADVAMYRAKAEGKSRYVVFEPAMRDRLQARTELESELRRAVRGEQFTVHYQPVVDAAAGTVVSTEALLRWEHPRRGLVPPAEFVPLAEDTGLIVAIGAQVLRAACRQTASGDARPALADLSVSVNLSPRQLQEPGLLDDVREALRVLRPAGRRPRPGDHREPPGPRRRRGHVAPRRAQARWACAWPSTTSAPATPRCPT